MNPQEKHTKIVKEIARRHGFDFVGISKAERLDKEAGQLEEWLRQGHHGKMSYMERHFDKRIDPAKLVPGAKSVITLLYNYHTEKQQPADAPKISIYAYGKDYHRIIKEKCRLVVEELTDAIGQINGRIFVDSAPVLEKAWAQRSGTGWVGKHTNLITKQHGSFYFLAELIIDLPLEADGPIQDYCGTCTRCMDACPTDAIYEPYKLDASRCISYLTIELRDQIPEKFQGQMEGWAFGCDICQDVCPWNRFAQKHHEPRFEPTDEIREMGREEWTEITEEVFRELFRKSAVKRTKFLGLKRNLNFLARAAK